MPTVDTREYVSALKELTEEGHLVGLTVSGWSMAPFLAHGRDRVYFARPERRLKRGDVVFYERDNGRYVLHRICRIHKDASGAPSYDMAGDAQTVLERGIRQEQIFARVEKVERKGRELSPASPLWLFFSIVWVRLLPMRHVLMKLRHP